MQLIIDYLTRHGVEILGTLIGVLYLYWEYKADMKVWIAGIVMPMLSLSVYYQAGLYADFGINIYYLVVAIYGYAMWQFSKGKKTGVRLLITHTPRRLVGPLLVLTAVIYSVIAAILVKYTDSTVPYWDALTTAFSIVGMWMLARKYVEQWWVWIVVDFVSTGLYIYKGIPFYAALYGAYTVIAWKGYKQWKRLMTLPQTW